VRRSGGFGRLQACTPGAEDGAPYAAQLPTLDRPAVAAGEMPEELDDQLAKELM